MQTNGQVLRVGIVGCGAIGNKRAANLGAAARLVACADTDDARARALAGKYPGATAAAGWRAVVDDPAVDAVIVATTHDMLAPITLAAVERGKHVLVEKPAARRADELAPIVEAARRTGAAVRIGFNHRFHPALREARGIVDSGALGDLLYIRGRYGHGGRIGYDKEWRADPARSGGGELLDQGVHLIDLARWFLGDFSSVSGSLHTYFWKMPVEDNAFMLLETARRQTAFLHVSWTEWKNLFCLEIFGRDGKLQVDGLGGSYGPEKLTWYRMKPEMGPPEITAWDYDARDLSWQLEFDTFVEDIRLRREPAPGLTDARAVLGVVGQLYGHIHQPASR